MEKKINKHNHGKDCRCVIVDDPYDGKLISKESMDNFMKLFSKRLDSKIKSIFIHKLDINQWMKKNG